MNILIIDDHKIVKEGIEARIHETISNATCYFASNLKDVISKIHAVSIDLAFCDLEFPNELETDGFEIVKRIQKYKPTIKVIAFTSHNSYRIMKKAKSAGFQSFLDKGCSINEFSDTLLNVISSDTYYTSESAKRLLKKRNGLLSTIYSESLSGISDLSKRERELTILSSKTTNRLELGEIMNVAPGTIDTYYKNILSKLQLKHRQELILFSLEFKEMLLQYDTK